MQKLFVWDFHGTLEKGNERAAIEISNAVLAARGYKQTFTEQQAAELYGKKWYEYFEFLLPDEPHDTHVLLQQTAFEWPEAETIVAKYMQPNDHVEQVLQAIKEAGHLQIVISNTSAYALPIFLRLAGVDKFFDKALAFAVMGHSREVKRTKAHVVADYLQQLEFKPEIVSIGDSEKDMLLAREFNGKGYWYKHPHQPVPEIVERESNIVAISDLRQVLAEL